MTTVEKALEAILEAVQPVGLETVPLTEALGRILGERVAAPRDHPPWDNSAMDGYAVRHEDTVGGGRHPVSLKLVGSIPAGMLPRRRLERGEAVRIATGAPLPEGADAVIRIEEAETAAGGREITVRGEIRPGKDVRRRGEDVRLGEVVLSPGTVIGPPEIGILALAQKGCVAVSRRPRVAILATGEELVEPWERTGDCQIVNTNNYALAAQVAASGGEFSLLGIAGDDVTAIAGKIRCTLSSSDLVLISGGVGPGGGDRGREVLEGMGAEIRFRGVALRPGHPTIFGRIKNRPIFFLPGNPVAAMVAFFVLVRPALLKMVSSRILFPPLLCARLLTDLHQRPGKRHYLRAVIRADRNGLVAEPLSSQGSGMLTSMGKANGFIVLPESSEGARAGEPISVELFRDLTESTGGRLL